MAVVTGQYFHDLIRLKESVRIFIRLYYQTAALGGKNQ